jgi:hypothetical protein
VTHTEATKAAAQEDCLSCYAPAPSEPAHYPKHRGMGGASAGWEPTEWVPLCRRCHDRLDRRNGVSAVAIYQSEAVRDALEAQIPAWRRRWT